MILFHHVIEILHLANVNGRAMIFVVTLDRRSIGRTAIDRDLLWRAVAANGLGQKPLGSFLITLLGEQKVNGLAVFVYGAVQILPLTLHFDIRLIHTPTHPYRTLAAVECVL